jgi:hypothetical protein
MSVRAVLLTCCICGLARSINAAGSRLLVPVHPTAYSHVLGMRRIAHETASRGHEVLVRS